MVEKLVEHRVMFSILIWTDLLNPEEQFSQEVLIELAKSQLAMLTSSVQRDPAEFKCFPLIHC